MKRPYKRALGAYAAVYGSGLRTVKHWVKAGLQNHDPCPLDRPEDMPAWWERNMVHTVPEKIWNAANGDPGPPSPWNPSPGPRPPAASASAVPAILPPGMPAPGEAPPSMPPPAVDFLPLAAGPQLDADVSLPEGVLGMQAEYERVERLAAILGQTASQPGKTKAYLDAVQRMTVLHGKIREENERTRRLIPKEEAEQMLHDLHGPLEREIRLLIEPLCETLQVPPVPEIHRKWNALVDQLCDKLQREVFQ